jgi:hypothetical protein
MAVEHDHELQIGWRGPGLTVSGLRHQWAGKRQNTKKANEEWPQAVARNHSNLPLRLYEIALGGEEASINDSQGSLGLQVEVTGFGSPIVFVPRSVKSADGMFGTRICDPEHLWIGGRL